MIEATFDAASVRDALVRRAETLRAALEVRIRQKLSGEALQTHSGALETSIRSSVEDRDSSASILASSIGVPYSAIQEFGGKTAAHDIVATKGQALAFSSGGKQIFARSLHHPGSTIPAHSYIGGSLAELADDIALGLKQAVLEALRQE